MTTITIPLTKPVPGHGGEVREIILREPTWDDIMPVGHPYVIHTSSEGITIPVANPDAIQHYLEKCLVEPKHPLLLGAVCLVDTLRVRQAILDFFLNAESEGAA